MRIAYFDCFAGISGDMALGALLDAGADRDALVEGLSSLNLPGWELQVRKTAVHGLSATDVEVLVGGRPAGDAPTVDLGHGHEHEHEHGHTGGTVPAAKPHGKSASGRASVPPSHAGLATGSGGPSPSHSHHEHEHDGDHHHTRRFVEIQEIIRSSGLPAVVKEKGEAVFTRLAEAEAKVHNVELAEVHFHEVGAVDSIVDILGAVYALHLLGVERVAASALPNGHGFIRAAHGLLPIPAPATAELLKGVPLRSVDVESELVTPTGAALLRGLGASFGPMPSLRLTGTGYGAGKRRFEFPNLLRVMIGETADVPEANEVTLLEANLDDMSPQLYEHVMERLLQAGALDVYLQPVQMKKNRPGQLLAVLCDPARAAELARIVLRETTTLGIRQSSMQRYCLEREVWTVPTPYGEVRVKIGRLDGDIVTVSPEYDDCRARALESGAPLKEVQAAAVCAARAKGIGR